MKQLTDSDLAKMIDEEIVAPDRATVKSVRAELKLSRLIPQPEPPTPSHCRLDLHQRTEEQAWELLNTLVRSGARTATVITGASGILKPKFQDWVKNSTIAPYIQSCEMVNRGSFEIRIKRDRGGGSYS